MHMASLKIETKTSTTDSKIQMHLVDKPKSNGFGSTNDGNTARGAFENTKLFAKVTNVDERLIKKCKVILTSLLPSDSFRKI